MITHGLIIMKLDNDRGQTSMDSCIARIIQSSVFMLITYTNDNFLIKKNLQKKYEYNTADSLSGIPSAVYELFKVKDETRQKISPNKCIICATFPPPTIRLHPGTLLQFPVKNPCVCHFPEIKYRFLYIYIKKNNL